MPGWKTKEAQQAYYLRNKRKYYERSTAWRKANPERASEIAAKYNKAYYMRVQSPLATRACILFAKMNEERRVKFAKAIMERDTSAWDKAKRQYALDEWLGAYSGI